MTLEYERASISELRFYIFVGYSLPKNMPAGRLSKAYIISKVEASHRWIDENHDALAKKYNDRWIAVLDREVIDSDPDLEKITARAKRQLGSKYSQVVIEYVSRKPLNLVL